MYNLSKLSRYLYFRETKDKTLKAVFNSPSIDHQYLAPLALSRTNLLGISSPPLPFPSVSSLPQPFSLVLPQ